MCLECSLSVRSVARSAIFQTLCITPDTLAFNTSGNVCFMELLSGEAPGHGGRAGARRRRWGEREHRPAADSGPSLGTTVPEPRFLWRPGGTCSPGPLGSTRWGPLWGSALGGRWSLVSAALAGLGGAMGPPSPLPPLQGAFPHCRSSRGSPSNHGAPEPENGPHGAGAGGGSAPWGAGAGGGSAPWGVRAGVSTPRRAPQALTRALSSSPDDPEGAFVPPEFDVTGNTFEVSGRRPGGQRGKGCREPAQPAPGRDRGCQGTRLPRLRVDSRRSCSKHWCRLQRGRNGHSPAEAARRGRCGSVGGSQAGWRWRPRGRQGPWAPLRALPRGSLTHDVPRGQAARPPAW